jgi:HK97 gp10 family phage protein
MAKLTIEGMDEIQNMLDQLAQPTKMAIKAVNAASPILEESLKSSIEAAANHGYATGELAGSIVATPAAENSLGVYSVVRAVGSDKKGLRNVEKMAYLEYGTRRKDGTGQEPHPVRQNAINAAQDKCESVIEKTIAKEVDSL